MTGKKIHNQIHLSTMQNNVMQKVFYIEYRNIKQPQANSDRVKEKENNFNNCKHKPENCLPCQTPKERF